jgi:hypothetical protein
VRPGGDRLSRTKHRSPAAARKSLSRLLSGQAGRDRGREGARAYSLRWHQAWRKLESIAAAVARIHLVRRQDGQPARYSPPSQSGTFAALDPAIAAADLAIRAATASRAAGNDLAPRQRTGGAPLCFVACAKRGDPVRCVRGRPADRTGWRLWRDAHRFIRQASDCRAQRRRAGKRRIFPRQSASRALLSRCRRSCFRNRQRGQRRRPAARDGRRCEPRHQGSRSRLLGAGIVVQTS